MTYLLKKNNTESYGLSEHSVLSLDFCFTSAFDLWKKQIDASVLEQKEILKVNKQDYDCQKEGKDTMINYSSYDWPEGN